MTYTLETFVGKSVSYKTTHGSSFRLGRDERYLISYRTTASDVFLPNPAWCRVGHVVSIRSAASGTLTIKKWDGATVTTISVNGQERRFALTDNSTAGGTWSTLPARTLNTPRTLGTTRGATVNNPTAPTTYTPTCPKFFVLRSCTDEADIVTDTDLLDYVGEIVLVSEGTGCFHVDIWNGPEPTSPTSVTVLNSSTRCNDLMCGECVVVGHAGIVYGGIADYAGSAIRGYDNSNWPGFISGVGGASISYAPGLFKVSYNRDAGDVKLVRYETPAVGIDLDDITTITVSLTVSCYRGAPCGDNAFNLHVTILWDGTATGQATEIDITNEPGAIDSDTGTVVMQWVWERISSTVFDFKPLLSGIVSSTGEPMSVLEDLDDINVTNADLTALRVMIAGQGGQGVCDYPNAEATIANMKICFTPTYTP